MNTIGVEPVATIHIDDPRPVRSVDRGRIEPAEPAIFGGDPQVPLRCEPDRSHVITGQAVVVVDHRRTAVEPAGHALASGPQPQSAILGFPDHSHRPW